MINPILTIAIPTYNRPEKIHHQVISLLSQNNKEVKIIVLDNHSDVPVRTLFDENVLNEITIIRHKFNIGGDGNIARCFDVCETEWLWTLSDDDNITDDAVNTILKDISRYKESLYINYNRKVTREIKGLKSLNENSYDHYSNLFYISACVYNILKLKKYMHYYYRAISTMQPGVCLLVKALSEDNNNTIMFSDKRVVAEGDKGIGWNREAFLFATLYVFDYLRSESIVLNKGMFKHIASMCCMNILLIFNKDRIFFKALRLHRILLKRRGWFLSLTTDFKQNCLFVAHLSYMVLFGKRLNEGD